MLIHDHPLFFALRKYYKEGNTPGNHATSGLAGVEVRQGLHRMSMGRRYRRDLDEVKSCTCQSKKEIGVTRL
jgi:hypothetical protein